MDSQTQKLSGADFSPDINMVRYLQAIRKFPILTAEEEYNLAVEYKETKSKKCSDKLVNAHLRLVAKIVSKYKGYGLPVSEMIAEGNVGLLYAVDKFDPEKGFRFSTYALWWIKASIQKYILNSWSLVKIGTTAAQKKLFFNLRKIKNKLNLMDDRDLTNVIMKNIAKTLSVKVQDVKDMNARLKSHDGSLNIVIDASSESGSEWMDFIADKKPNQEELYSRTETNSYRKKLFNQAIVCLNDREKDILFKRRLADKAITLDELSKSYNISKERVRQIELNCIKKIKKNLDVPMQVGL